MELGSSRLEQSIRLGIISFESQLSDLDVEGLLSRGLSADSDNRLAASGRFPWA